MIFDKLLNILRKKDKCDDSNTNSGNKETTSIMTYRNTKYEKIEKINLYSEYGKTLLLSAYGKCSPLPEKYPLYFERECNISNPRLLHQQLIDEWYLVPSNSEQILLSFTIPDLKTILTSYGLKVSGRKVELINRILENTNLIELEEFLYQESTRYSLSEKGKEFLEEHNDYFLLHRNSNWGIGIEEYLSIKNQIEPNTFYDICIHIFKKRMHSDNLVRKHMTHVDFMHLYKQNKETSLALYHELVALYYTVNFVDKYEYCKSMKNLHVASNKLKQHCFDDLDMTHYVTLADAKSIAQYSDIYKEDIIDKIYITEPIPNLIITNHEFKLMISDMLNSTNFDWNKWDSYIKDLYRNRLKL